MGRRSRQHVGKAVVRFGALSAMVDITEQILLDAELPFYQRGNALVRPVITQVDTFHGKKTSTVELVKIEVPYLRDAMCRVGRVDEMGCALERVGAHAPAGAGRRVPPGTAWALAFPGNRGRDQHADAAAGWLDPLSAWF